MTSRSYLETAWSNTAYVQSYGPLAPTPSTRETYVLYIRICHRSGRSIDGMTAADFIMCHSIFNSCMNICLDQVR